MLAIRRACAVRLPLSVRLKECRYFAGLTQKALAKRTGIPEDKISLLESGKTRGYLDEIRAIVVFTGCGDRLAEILQCWREFVRPPRKPRTDSGEAEVEVYDDIGARDE